MPKAGCVGADLATHRDRATLATSHYGANSGLKAIVTQVRTAHLGGFMSLGRENGRKRLVRVVFALFF